MPVVMGGEIADVFKHESLGLLCSQDFFDAEKEGPLCLVLESFLVADAGKRLTWETTKKNIEIRDVSRVDFLYVTERFFAEIARVRLGGVFVPFGRKNAFSADRLKP